jgi:uncharacterized membrane protein YgaE (UPF0421/DUF939 family)
MFPPTRAPNASPSGISRQSALIHRPLYRLRDQLWPILETAGAAVIAWYLAQLLLSDRETGFAPIAAVICLGATLGQQRERALELMGGVVVGVLIADLLVRLLGTGPPQVGLMVVLAMSAAAVVGGGPLLMTESGVSAIIIGSAAPTTLGLFPTRPIEALIGGAVAFGVHSLVFPPNPLVHVSRAAHVLFGGLGHTLEELAAVLETGDAGRAQRALEAARSLDGDMRALGEALALGRETARTAPLRWVDRAALDRQEEIGRHLDFAVRNTRVLARDTVRYVRANGAPVPDVAAAIAGLGRAIWALAAAFDDPDTREQPRRLALLAAGRASEAMARHADLMLTEIAGQVRSTAVDLVRAAQAGTPDEDAFAEASTEEMLADPPDTPAGGLRANPRRSPT